MIGATAINVESYLTLCQRARRMGYESPENAMTDLENRRSHSDSPDEPETRPGRYYIWRHVFQGHESVWQPDEIIGELGYDRAESAYAEAWRLAGADCMQSWFARASVVDGPCFIETGTSPFRYIVIDAQALPSYDGSPGRVMIENARAPVAQKRGPYWETEV